MRKIYIISIFFIFIILISKAFSQPLSLITPKNNSISDSAVINLEWNSKSGSIFYNIEVSTDEQFSTIFSTHNTTNTTYVDTLNFNETYWWRVRSNDGFSFSNWSLKSKFSIINPTKFYGLSMWQNAGSGLTMNGTHVNVWHDLSGNSNNSIQGDPNGQPLLLENIINSKPVLRFDGIDDFFLMNSPITIGTVFMVLNWNGGGQVFPNYNSPLSSNHAPNWDVFYTITNDYNIVSPYAGFNIFINNIPFNDFRPLERYKILMGKGAPKLFNELYVGLGEALTSRAWYGDIAEIITYDNQLNSTQIDSIFGYLHYKYAPPVNLGQDISIPYGICDTFIDAGNRFTNYIWSTGDTTQSINVINSGCYSVTATDVFGYQSSDTVLVNKPSLKINDTTFCQNSSVNITTGLGANYAYNWSTLATTENISINVGGTYSLTVTDTLGCSAIDTFIVTENMFSSTASLGPDKAICDGDFIGLVSGNSQAAYYQWSDFSTGPTLQISTINTYSLTVTSIDGCVAVDSIYITIKGPLPVPDFFVDSACVGNPTHFYDNSTIPFGFNIVSLQWDFGEPGSGLNNTSTLPDPIHTYAQDGTYFVHLTATSDSGCVKTISKEVTVYSLPVANFSPVNGCTGVPIQFEDLSTNAYGNITGWQWNFGDASPPSTNHNPSHNYSSAGTYQVTLTVFTEANCINSVTKTVTIRESLQPDFSYTSVCFGNPVYFTDLTPTDPWSEINEWVWTFGDGDSSNTVNPVHVFDTAGTYQVTLMVRSLNGCRISITKAVMVNANPIADFTFSTICQNIEHPFTDNSSVQNDTIANWNWTFDSFGTSHLQNPLFAFPDTGSFNVTLLVKSDDGCSETVTRTVQVYPVPVANFSFDPEFGIAPLLVHFTDESIGGFSYHWNFDYLSFTDTGQNPLFTYISNGIYHVQLITTNGYGCPDTIVKDVRVIPSSVDIGVNTVYASKTSDFLSIGVDMTNYGTRKIDSVYLDAFVDGGTIFRETFVGTINPGAMQHYSFASQLSISNQNPQFVCITASLPVLDQETNLINNDSCYTFSEEFFCLEPFPNPANNLLNIYFILPFDDPVEVSLYDSKGSKLKSIYAGLGTEGLNRITYNLLNLSNGIYAYKIIFRDKSVVKKFMKY